LRAAALPVAAVAAATVAVAGADDEWTSF
jgi:hypothetical protein